MSFDDPFNLSNSFSSFRRDDFNTSSSDSSEDFVEFERFTSFEGGSVKTIFFKIMCFSFKVYSGLDKGKVSYE